MKKTLLATTALGLLAASSAYAAGPTVKLGGSAEFQVGSADQEALYETQNDGANTDSRYSRDLHTRTNTALTIDVDGKTDSGLGYGAHIVLEADVNADDGTGANNNAESGYIYVESGFGRVEVGPTYDAGNALKVDASNLARATGGIAGDFYKYVALGAATTAASSNPNPNDEYFILPGLPTAVGLPGEANSDFASGDIHKVRATANKISYYSPRIQGLQLGVSYTPDQNERGTKSGFSGSKSSTAAANAVGLEDVWNAGLNYEGEYQNVGIQAAVTGEWGDAENQGTTASTLDGLSAYQAGVNLSYAGVTVGGSVADISEFGQTATSNEEVGYWTLGAAYEFGPFAASVTYLDSTVENQGGTGVLDKEFTNLSIGADYQLAPGFVPYVEVSFFETDDNVADTATVVDNEGTVFIIGTGLTF